MAKSVPRYRRFCFTWFGKKEGCSQNQGEAKELSDRIVAKLSLPVYIVYYVFQIERCPESRRLHGQGYIRCNKVVRVATLKDATGPEVHFESCKGTEEDNIKYCTKLDSRVLGPFEAGKRVQSGQRNDLSAIREKIISGLGMKDIIELCPNYQALRYAELLLKYCEKPRDCAPEVRWYSGSTGSGKTRAAVEEFPGAWISGKNLNWFEGYDAHEVVIIDDFRCDFCSFHMLLRLLDRYEFRIENKGGSRQFVARIIIITCPFTARECFKHKTEENLAQLERRILIQRSFGEVVLRTPPSAQADCYIFPPRRNSR